MSDLESDGGSKGGGVVTVKSRPYRAALNALEKQLRDALPLTEAELRANILFAVTLRDREGSTDRERVRAVELLEKMRQKGIDVAMYLDQRERPAAATQVEHRHTVRFQIERDDGNENAPGSTPPVGLPPGS